jgi:hypothetical protein
MTSFLTRAGMAVAIVSWAVVVYVAPNSSSA